MNKNLIKILLTIVGFILGIIVLVVMVEKDKTVDTIKYNGKNAYLTGDLGYLKDGNLYYKCRKDNQIKYKGYRIELSDIEENLYNLKFAQACLRASEQKGETSKAGLAHYQVQFR